MFVTLKRGERKRKQGGGEGVRNPNHTPPQPLRSTSVLGWVLLFVHRNRRLIRDGSPERPPRRSHSSWALKLCTFTQWYIYVDWLSLRDRFKTKRFSFVFHLFLGFFSRVTEDSGLLNYFAGGTTEDLDIFFYLCSNNVHKSFRWKFPLRSSKQQRRLPCNFIYIYLTLNIQPRKQRLSKRKRTIKTLIMTDIREGGRWPGTWTDRGTRNPLWQPVIFLISLEIELQNRTPDGNNRRQGRDS